MNLDEALGLLTTDPKALLDRAYVSLIGGDENSRSGPAIFALSKDPAMQGMYKRVGSNKTLPAFRIELKQGQAIMPQKYRQDGTDYLTFSAYYIAMKKMGAGPEDAPQATYYALPARGPIDLAVTSQLSGCTFGIGSQSQNEDGCCTVSHIQPSGKLAEAQPIMAAQTRKLHEADPRVLVAKGSTYGDRAHVLGKRDNGVWRFYIQKFQGGFARLIEPAEEL